jgi:hypothetical protein
MEKVITYVKSNPLVAVILGVATLGIGYHLLNKKKAVEKVVIGDGDLEAKSETKENLSQDEANKLAKEIGDLIEFGKRARFNKEGKIAHDNKIKELKAKLVSGGYEYQSGKAVKKSTASQSSTQTVNVSLKLKQADADRLASMVKSIYDAAPNGTLSKIQMDSVRQTLSDLSKAGYRYENGKAVPSGNLASNQVVSGTIGGQPLVVTKGGFSSDNANKIF